MARKNTAVFAIFALYEMLEDAISELKNAGFRSEDMSVLLPENLGSKELATVKASKGPEGVATGAGSGAVVGGALGWLAGIGALASLADSIAAHGINIRAIGGAEIGGSGGVALMVNDDQEDGLERALRSAGYTAVEVDSVEVEIEDQPGALAEVARRIADAGVNLVSILIIADRGERVLVSLGIVRSNVEPATRALGLSKETLAV